MAGVDALVVDPSGVLQLTLEEAHPWDWDRLVALQDRINACLVWVESGEIFLAYPQALEVDIRIDVVMRHRPTDDALSFLQQASAMIENAGFLFRFGPPKAGYLEDAS